MNTTNHPSASPPPQEAIILAGGLGTRLRSAVPDLPKCMAPVAGRPFLAHVVDQLRRQGIRRFIFSLGYKHEQVTAYLEEHYPTMEYAIALESEPLGTGGAIRLSLEQCQGGQVLIANGDTLFRISLPALWAAHEAAGAECTLALKPMQDFDRYGVVETDAAGRITSFREKQHYSAGLINGGVYVLDKKAFLDRDPADRFSFEKDYLETHFKQARFYGFPQEGYFIDIGIPEDYGKANTDLASPALQLDKVDASWTLFLDRDGVINEEKLGEYILHWDEFIFSKGVLDVFKKLSDRFGRIIIVTNQRGVGKGLMTEAALQSIHYEMQREVEIVGGRIDKVYYCTDMDNRCFYRKPNPGMALLARQDFSDIDLAKSIMVGNKPSDMRFGRAAGMFTVFVRTTNPEQEYPHPDIDLVYPTLADFARDIEP